MSSTDPGVENVVAGVTYTIDDVELEGTFVVPVIGDVRQGVGYGAEGTQYVGILGASASSGLGRSDRATQSDILGAIVQRLRQRVPNCTESLCFLADQPLPMQWPAGGHVCITVSVGNSQFDESMWAGGGYSTLCETLQVQVTIWLRALLDQPPRTEQALRGEEGMFSRYKPEILRALLMQKLEDGRMDAWMPIDPTGVGLLRQPLQPLGCSVAKPDAENTYVGMTLTFLAMFDWKL